MDIFGEVARLGLFVATAILFSVVLFGYLRLRNRKKRSSKMLFITLGFGIFFLHALVTIPELWNINFDIDFNESWHLFIDLIGLIFILVGTLME